MAAVDRDPVVSGKRRHGKACGDAVALDEAVAVGVCFLRAPQVDDQLLALVQVLHTKMVDL
jgi:hypothetical protein